MKTDGIYSWFAKMLTKIGVVLQIFGLANVEDILAAFWGAIDGTTEEESTTIEG